MSDQRRPNPGDHPKGTLAIVGLYGLLFALGWLAFFFIYLRRGAVTP